MPKIYAVLTEKDHARYGGYYFTKEYAFEAKKFAENSSLYSSNIEKYVVVSYELCNMKVENEES